MIFKRLLLISFMALLFAGAAYAEEKEFCFVDGTNVNMRETPSLTGKVIAKLQENEKLTLLEQPERYETINKDIAIWVKVETEENKIGYVFGSFLRDQAFGKAFMCFSENRKERALVLSNSQIYAFPTEKSKPMKNILNGEEVEVLSKITTPWCLERNEYWYSVKKGNIKGFIKGEKIISRIIKFGDFIYGISEVPGEMEDTEWRFINTYSKVIVYSPKKSKVIQELELKDKTDTLSLSIADFFNKTLKTKAIAIKHDSNHMTTGPWEYAGLQFFLLENNGKIGKNIFSMFSHIGAQDEPSASLEKTTLTNKSLEIEYQYIENCSASGLGKGSIKLTYSIENLVFKLNKIESSIIQTHQYINNTYSNDDKHKLEKPDLLNFDKNTLNSKFTYMTKVYPFIFE